MHSFPTRRSSDLILNRKKVQIEQLIEKDLLDAVNVGLEAYKQQDASQTEEIKQQILDTIGPDAFNEKGELDKLYRNSPLGKKYLDALKKAEKQQEIGRASCRERV